MNRLFKRFGKLEDPNKLNEEGIGLGLTICQVPVIYHSSDNEAIEVLFANGTSQNIVGHEVDESISQSIFNRDKKIIKLNVYIQANKG